MTEIRTATSFAQLQSLRPASADYKAVFQDAFATKAERYYNATFWDRPATAASGRMAPPDRTEIRIWKAATEDIAAWTPDVRQHFPGGYEKIRAEFKPGLTVYTWDYIRPGEERGTTYNGLVHVNGHWAIFPKPWQVNES